MDILKGREGPDILMGKEDPDILKCREPGYMKRVERVWIY